MTPATFCEQFATFAEAPNGVAKLRELILQLAVQGKLGTQDVNDEPVDVLLHRLGLHRTPSPTEAASRTSDAALVDLPSTWAIVSLSEIANIVYGKNLPTSQLKAEGFPVFGANGVIGCYDRFLYETPQLLISCRGAYSGKINMSPPKVFITNNSLVVELFAGLESMREYLFHALAAIDRSAIITGTAQPQVTVGNAVQLRIPIPPLAEQRRIVGKVDQLLGLCDELAARQAARREARSALVGATLDRLISARSAADQTSRHPACRGGSRASALPEDSAIGSAEAREPLGQAQWRVGQVHRLRDHFDRLFDTPTTLPQLRQAILQLAVQGQLVPQDENDEGAATLLEKIRVARSTMQKGGRSKPSDDDGAPSTIDEPYTLPSCWVWTRLDEVQIFTNGYAFKSDDYRTAGIGIVQWENSEQTVRSTKPT